MVDTFIVCILQICFISFMKQLTSKFWNTLDFLLHKFHREINILPQIYLWYVLSIRKIIDLFNVYLQTGHVGFSSIHAYKHGLWKMCVQGNFILKKRLLVVISKHMGHIAAGMIFTKIIKIVWLYLAHLQKYMVFLFWNRGFYTFSIYSRI